MHKVVEGLAALGAAIKRAESAGMLKMREAAQDVAAATLRAFGAIRQQMQETGALVDTHETTIKGLIEENRLIRQRLEKLDGIGILSAREDGQ